MGEEREVGLEKEIQEMKYKQTLVHEEYLLEKGRLEH